MNLNDLSEAQQQFLTVIEAFDEPVNLNVLASLVPISSLELLDLTTDLTQAGWLERINHSLRLTSELPVQIRDMLRRNLTPNRLLKLVDRIRGAGLQDQIDSTVMIRLLDDAGHSKAAGHLAYENALAEIDKRDWDAAFENHVRAISLLTPYLGDEACDKRYILATLSLSDLVVYLRRDHQIVLKVLSQAKKACRLLGDKRNLALMHLHTGRVSQTINLCVDAVRSFAKGIKMVEALGDEDIKAQADEFYGLYHYLLGHVRHAAEHYERAQSTEVLREGQVSNPLIPIFQGNSLALMGQFYRAIGLLDASWRRAEMHGDASSARFYQADLGNVLLMAGKRAEGFQHLSDAEEQSMAHEDTWSLFWAQRALAFYFMMEGHFEKSFEKLKSSLESMVTAGFHRPYFGLPWILELLFEYHKKGYGPLSGWDFETEMAAALNGINALLRGTALRIRAQMASSQKEAPQAVEALLRKSETDLTEAEAPVDLARTTAELAKLKLETGQHQEALELALKSWEGLAVCGHDAFPEELTSLIHGHGDQSPDPPGTREILDRYVDLINEILPTDDSDEMLTKTVAASCRFFKAERGGLFTMGNEENAESMRLRAGYNLTREDIQRSDFQKNLEHVFKAFRSNRPHLVRLNRKDDPVPGPHFMNFICLPLVSAGRTLGVLYHDSTYSTGAFDFLDLPILRRIAESIGNIVIRLRHQLERMEQNSSLAIQEAAICEETSHEEIKTQTDVMRDLLTNSDRVAKTDVPILILGETGVGKELLARRIHRISPRETRPFIAVNLSSVPETLVESELFGHEKGAFTGANRQRKGRMELANKGSLFIDEVGDMPAGIQVKLLRALEEKAFFRVGGARSIKSDFRLVAATNRDLVKAVESGRFREDLYYRLNVVPLTVPPLRERENDIPYLAEHFFQLYERKFGRKAPALTLESKHRLMAYGWPGNVRELKNVIERSMALSNESDPKILVPDYAIRPHGTEEEALASFADMPSMEDLQRRYIQYILEKSGMKISGPGGAADILGMKRTTLYTRMKKLGLSP